MPTKFEHAFTYAHTHTHTHTCTDTTSWGGNHFVQYLLTGTNLNKLFVVCLLFDQVHTRLVSVLKYVVRNVYINDT